MDRFQLHAHINYHGPEWQLIRKWLLDQREVEINRLIKATTQEESNEYRGAIRMLDRLLNTEKDAERASQQGH